MMNDYIEGQENIINPNLRSLSSNEAPTARLYKIVSLKPYLKIYCSASNFTELSTTSLLILFGGAIVQVSGSAEEREVTGQCHTRLRLSSSLQIVKHQTQSGSNL